MTTLCPETSDQVNKVLREFLAGLDPELVGDAEVFTPAEWREQGETGCRNSCGILTFDGSWLYEVFNAYDCGQTAADVERRLREALNAVGCIGELQEPTIMAVYK